MIVRSLRALIIIACAALLHSAEGEELVKPTFQFQDFLVAPVRVHLLRSPDDPNIHTTLTSTDIERILTKVNRVWAQAGLAFYLESIIEDTSPPIEATKAAEGRSRGSLLKLIKPELYASDAFNVYYLKRFDVNGIYFPKAIFVKDTASLREVANGIDEPIPRVTSHEIGHALGLPHRQDTFNLMASGTTGTTLNAQEIADARKQALALGRFKPAQEIAEKVKADRDGGKDTAAAQILLHLSTLPGFQESSVGGLQKALQ
jgi:hypothetical protein